MFSSAMDELRSAVDLLAASMPDKVEGDQDACNGGGGGSVAATAITGVGSPSHVGATSVAVAVTEAAAAAASTSPTTTMSGTNRRPGPAVRNPNPIPNKQFVFGLNSSRNNLIVCKSCSILGMYVHC